MKKKMNVTFKALLLITICMFSISFSSCTKDNEYSQNREIAENIVGTWKIEQADTGDGFETWTNQTTSATFNEDGTYSGSGLFGNGTGTYKLKGNTITCYVSGDVFLVYKVITLNGNTATLIVEKPGESDKLSIICSKGATAQQEF